MSRHKISEEELIALLRKQDNKGITILYDNYSAALYGIIQRIIQNEDTAEDVLQEAFVKIWKSFSQYDNTKGKLFTWIVNVARNLAIDKVRSKDYNNTRKNQSLDNIVSFIDLNSNYQYNPDTIGMKELISKLSLEHKQVIDLLYLKGFTQAEAAEILALPLGTVKTRARMAIGALRKEFSDTNVTTDGR